MDKIVHPLSVSSLSNETLNWGPGTIFQDKTADKDVLWRG